MKIIGLMLSKKSAWCIGLSIRTALKWVDQLFVYAYLDRATLDIVSNIQKEFPDRVIAYAHRKDVWDEMSDRQKTLDAARQMGATHIAIIDDDEVVTENVIPNLRGWCETLAPGQLLELPMIAPWRGMEVYRDDSSVWSSAFITLAFKDAPNLGWKAANDGYTHHSRPPHGAMVGMADRSRPLAEKAKGGVMHLQWVSRHRTLAKSAWYKILEATRWPGRMTAEQLNRKYDEMVNEDGLVTSQMRTEWGTDFRGLDINAIPWQEAEAQKLFDSSDKKLFDGLILHGVVK